MEYIYSIGGIIAALYFTYVLMRPRKSDLILANLDIKKRKEREDAVLAIAKAQQELDNAKITARKSRDEYDAISGEGVDPE